ncbi:MAG: hypothetical protein VX505_04375 [Chloroflexota bacterium]|jgi:hypothetical protein|nr:hypothetical protein [Dehalococcoidia bacterium]MEE3013379.1 hypothetical protein [Chloroflexota bacterium]|tara:strand:+ start:146 stop:1096 length:951 start_codon:yes stop_codon:yes gene_type:complete
MVQAEIKTRFEVGPITFIARHELWDGNIQDHADQGVSIVVQGIVDGEETTLLRFNCFDVERSYIYGPENPNLKSDGPMMLAGRTEGSTGMGKLYRMDPTADGNPIGWTIKTMKSKLPDMLERAGYPEIAKELDLEELMDTLPELEATARELFVSKRNVVKHNRGTDIFEAGNIRFGLEMRRLPVGDGGLAIHVLSDLGGTSEKSYVEETELMAFDLFWDGPHYHYGPRNKNHRIYWDRTLVQDYLGWVLDKIEGKKLGAMIERAGYPGVAADLDQDMIDAVLPALTTKAREMLDLGESLTGHPGLPLDPTPNMVSN